MKCAHERNVTSVRRGRGRRAFTLIELLITVAMIGVLAAIGMVGYRRYIHSAQSSEAKSIIQGIRGGQDNFKGEFLTYLNVSASLDDYYPNATPNDSRMNFVQPGDSRYTAPPNACAQGMCGGWALLNVAVDAPVRFGYAVVAGVGGTPTAPTRFSTTPTMPALPAGVPWFVVQAKNTHNPNVASPKYAVFATSSVSAEIISENEQE